MNRKYKANGFILAAVALLAILILYTSGKDKQLYGNDNESVIQVIQSIDGYRGAEVELLETRDIGDDRYVAFLANNKPAYIEFNRNDKGNYAWSSGTGPSNEDFASFLIHGPEGAVPNFLFIANERSEVAKLELSVNDESIVQTFPVRQKSATWLELPKTEEDSYRFGYKYYDEAGSLLNSPN
ncbi:hypothetical protein [Paenibacillus methanolicus]|uniref:Uncharacterized protein n=1 Tax=Paenibacillus methanolicus TaxID=582686 RepID=A0A5S5C8R6_9BACL|nr:hypothetical protein [Paenibacillus methanolicus]TYP74776.1 hypothetical protein BCM02_105321 [Paenibacillus methanolicus]